MTEYQRDDFFDHNWSPGLITQMIFAQHEANPELVLSSSVLKTRFANAGCPDIAAMIDYLETEHGKGLQEFGSGSIMPVGQTSETPFSLEAAMGLRELYIGSKRSGLNVLQWLTYFSQIIDAVPDEARAVVNGLCRLIHGLQTGKTRTEPVTEK